MIDIYGTLRRTLTSNPDTVVQMISRLTMWIGSLTVLPGEGGFRATAKQTVKRLPIGKLNPKDFEMQQPPGFIAASRKINTSDEDEDRKTIQDRIIDRLATHLEAEELRQAAEAQDGGDNVERDIHFYHFVLARESQRLLKDLNASPPKKYQWSEWEYFLKLMSNDYDTKLPTGQKLVPVELRLAETQKEWERKREHHRWSWLGEKSPLMGYQSETEWLLERLTACLEKELRNSRLLPGKKSKPVPPPISLRDMVQREKIRGRGPGSGGTRVHDSGSSDAGDDLKREIEKDFPENEQVEGGHKKRE